MKMRIWEGVGMLTSASCSSCIVAISDSVAFRPLHFPFARPSSEPSRARSERNELIFRWRSRFLSVEEHLSHRFFH